ncbi:MAG: ImuA family protein [Phyllobacterium sp.]
MITVDLAALRRKVAAIGKAGDRESERLRTAFTFGFSGIDNFLGGGLQCGALHEVFAGETGDSAAATGFVTALAMRAGENARPVLWLEEDFARREHGGLYAPGLAAMGFDPRHLVIVRCPTARDVLKAASDVLEVREIGAVVLASWSDPKCLDLTATRRLLLGAQQSDVPAFMLRLGGVPSESAAMTRWQVRSAPSRSGSANAPGKPAFDVALLRNRQGTTGRWFMEWNGDEHVFRQLETVSGRMVSPPSHGQASAGYSTSGRF